MEAILKNIDVMAVLTLRNLLEYQPGKVVMKRLTRSEPVSLTLFALDKNADIETHMANGDAMVICVDGQGELIFEEKKFILNEGETMVIPAKTLHSVHAIQQFKMFLIVVNQPKA